MFAGFIAGLLTLLLGGEKAVARALGSFDKVIVDLERAITKLEAETEASIEREDAAYKRYTTVSNAEAQKQTSAFKAKQQATSVHAKVSELIKG